MKIYTVDFNPIYPVGGCLIIAAENIQQAHLIATKTITHTTVFDVKEIDISKPKIICYLSGDY
jgi:hypothetical protein